VAVQGYKASKGQA